MDLDNPVPTVLAEVDFSSAQGTGKWVCSICDMLVFATPIYYFLRFKEYFGHTLPMKL